jgi:hypothetical protein
MKKALERLSVILLVMGIIGIVSNVFLWKTEQKERSEEVTVQTSSEEAAPQIPADEPEEAEEPETVPEEEENMEEVQLVSNPAVGHLAFDLLDEETQAVYQDILYACEQHLENVELSSLNDDLLAEAYQAVTCDYGGLFWASGYTYTIRSMGDQVTTLEFAPNYLFTQEERSSYQDSLDEVVENCLAQIDPNASDYEKVKYVYEWLIDHVTYNLDSKENQNILSVFLYGESVCNGFASATQYLLTLMDVPCMIVYGNSEGQSHAWNLVYVDQQPYFLDCTWGDTVSATTGGYSYAYLNLSSSDIARTHQLDMLLDIPECTAVDANYYIREGRYFTVCDEQQIGKLLAESYTSGDACIDLRFSSGEVYQQVLDTFITNMKTTDYCEGLERVSYMENDKMWILTFMW